MSKNGLLCGVDNHYAVRSLTTTAYRILLALGNIGLTQSFQLVFTVHPHCSLIGCIGQHGAPLLL